MKKSILVMLSVIICLASINVVEARNVKTPALASAIKMYKAGNYSQAYVQLNEVVKKDPSNGLAYYYLGMTSAQMGNQSEAIYNYDKAVMLSPHSVLSKYAEKGKRCLETPMACNEPVATDNESEEEKFIRGRFGSGFSNAARGVHEKEKIQNLRREINREDDIAPQKFRDYKDFSAQAPSNDEIVNALRVLQRAGLSDVIAGRSLSSELSLLNGYSQNSTNEYDLLNTLLNGGKGSANVNPQLLQSLLSSQMSTGF